MTQITVETYQTEPDDTVQTDSSDPMQDDTLIEDVSIDGMCGVY